MGIMYKKNKDLLKKIYAEEYTKAEEKEQKAALNRELERIKSKARSDAKRKYTPKQVKAKEKGKKLAKKSKGIAKKMASFSKRQSDYDPLNINY